MTNEEAIRDIEKIIRTKFSPASVPLSLRIAIEALRREEERKWIPCSEQMPEAGEKVLVAIYGTDLIFSREGETFEQALARCQEEAARHPSVQMAALDEDGYWYDCGFGGPLIVQPSYWTWIPRPPKGGSHDSDM